MKKSILFLMLSSLVLFFTNCNNDDDSSSVSSNYSTYKAPDAQQKELNKTFPLNAYRKVAGENMITIGADRIGADGGIEGYFYFTNDRKNDNGKYYKREMTYCIANFDGKLLYLYNYDNELQLILELKYSTTSCKECAKTPYLMLHESTPQKEKIPFLMDMQIGIWY